VFFLFLLGHILENGKKFEKTSFFSTPSAVTLFLKGTRKSIAKIQKEPGVYIIVKGKK
jgi:hypothetical protein